METVSLELPAVPASVPDARHAIEGYASRLECDLLAVRIAVSETVGNCVMHAYDGEERGSVIVLGRVVRGRLVITVADRGGGVKPRAGSAGLGLGLPLVNSVAEDVRIQSDERGTVVAISFGLGSEGPRHTESESESEARARAGEVGAELERARQLVHRRGSAHLLRLSPAIAG